MDLLGKGIDDLSIVSNVAARDLRVPARVDLNGWTAEDRIFSPEFIGTLAPRRLVLAMNDTAASLIGSPMLSTLLLGAWHAVSHSVQTLEIKYMRSNTSELMQLIQGFESLQSLVLHGVALDFRRGPNVNHDMDSVI